MEIVFDASTLILLAKIELLREITEEVKVIIPGKVKAECLSKKTIDAILISTLIKEKKIEVITGVNLPMLLKLATYETDMDLETLAAFITDYGQRNINLASEVLKKRVEKKKG